MRKQTPSRSLGPLLLCLTALLAAAPTAQAEEADVIGERPRTESADEVFLRSQDILLDASKFSLEAGLFYAKREDQELAVVVDNNNQAALVLGRIEERSSTLNLVARYGVSERLQLFAAIPYQHQKATLVLDDGAGQGGGSTISRRSEWGDLRLGGRWMAQYEAPGRPGVILSLDGRLRNEHSSNALAGGVALVKSIDPITLFGNLIYQRTFSRDYDDVTLLQPEHTVTTAWGYAFAVNDRIALTTTVSGVFSRRAEFDNAVLREDQRFNLRFGLTAVATERLTIEPSVAFDISGTGSNFEIGVNLPYTF